MQRRQGFEKIANNPGTAENDCSVQLGAAAASGLLKSYSDEDHRRRLKNIRFGHENIRAAVRKHLVGDYLPGQCTYNLGEYPCIKPWDPDAWDEQELDRLQANGIELIQVHEEWNDALRRYGGTKLTALNPAGLQRFVEMVHRRGMKLIVYISTGFIERSDPDFRSEWARDQDLNEIYWRYARCSPASPSWRAYILPRLMRIMDEYGVDGLYNDIGYLPLAGNPKLPTEDEVFAFEENAKSDGALGDLLALIYAEVNRRGGIVKVHFSGAGRPLTDLKVYDYLWVGESLTNVDSLREEVKDYAPYLVPCLDMSRATIESEDELYINAIPYMQFPLLLAGRPFTGQRVMIPGVEYQNQESCFWTQHCRAIWKRYQEHPEGPHSYGWWDSSPGRPAAQPTHARWLKHYRPMVEEGTWAWLEVRNSSLFAQPLPKDVVASVFANRRLYLVLANYSHRAVGVDTKCQYTALAPKLTGPGTRWNLPARSLTILQRHEGD